MKKQDLWQPFHCRPVVTHKFIDKRVPGMHDPYYRFEELVHDQYEVVFTRANEVIAVRRNRAAAERFVTLLNRREKEQQKRIRRWLRRIAAKPQPVMRVRMGHK